MVRFNAIIHLDETTMIKKNFNVKNKTEAKAKALKWLNQVKKQYTRTVTFDLNLSDKEDIFFTAHRKNKDTYSNIF